MNIFTLLGVMKRKSADDVVIPIDENLEARIETMPNAPKMMIEPESLSKSFNGKETALSIPYGHTGDIVIENQYRGKRGTKGTQDIHKYLKQLSTNIIVDSIIKTRANQVAAYCNPAALRADRVGFEIVPKDNPTRDLSPQDVKAVKDIEKFLVQTGDDFSPRRDSFKTWAKKSIRDIMVYDQTNTENVFRGGKGSELISFVARDASNIYLTTDKEGNEPKGQNSPVYAQVFDGMVVRKFRREEMSFESMNPRTDVYAGGYGLSPLEIASSHITWHNVVEEFNHKYFSQGGTTMGLLHIKAGGQSSQGALENFRRDWTSMFSGVNGAWKIPVITADDVKYVNMNQSSRDMEFEKWLNYLINVLSAEFSIDPAEINFPNRGGATGSKGNSLQEASKKETSQLSKNKGLDPLLGFIEDIVNRNIMPYKNKGKYMFRFKGDGLDREIQMLDKEIKEVSVWKTVNELRIEKGKEAIDGGDIVLSAFFIQSLGQIAQHNQMEDQQRMEKLQMMMGEDGGSGDPTDMPTDPDDSEDDNDHTGEEKDKAVTTQDMQAGLTGDVSTKTGTKKDGQLRDEQSANSAKEGGKKD